MIGSGIFASDAMSTKTLESFVEGFRDGADDLSYSVEAMADRCAYAIRAVKKFANGTQLVSVRMLSYDILVKAKDGIASYVRELLKQDIRDAERAEVKKDMATKDLMEVVNAGEVANDPIETRVQSALEQAEELAALGFKNQAEKIRARANLKDRMNKVRGAYVKITEDKIKAFLARLVEEYDAKYAGLKKRRGISEYGNYTNIVYVDQYASAQQQMLANMQNMYAQQMNTGIGLALGSSISYQKLSAEPYACLRAQTCHYSGGGEIGQFVWKEMRIADYEGIPPKPVLSKLAEEKKKNLFDEFTIATVEGVKDPLLLGRFKDNSDRFFLAQWGDDVCLDDVI